MRSQPRKRNFNASPEMENERHARRGGAQVSNSSLTLYEISDHLVSLIDTYDMCETDEQRAECRAEIERTIDAQVRKVDSFCRFLSHIESQMELADKEVKRIKAREDVFARLLERLKQYAIFTMQQSNVRVLEGDTSKLMLRTNTPGVDIDDAAAVPPKFKTLIPATWNIDKRNIKKAIDAGEEVPGVHLREPSVSLLRK